MIAVLFKRGGVVKSSVHHHESNVGAVANVLERIAVQHDQIGKLARSERTKVAVESKILGAMQRRGAKGFVIGQIESLKGTRECSGIVVRPAVAFASLETVLVVLTHPAPDVESDAVAGGR